jgi:hypothetical protein
MGSSSDGKPAVKCLISVRAGGREPADGWVTEPPLVKKIEAFSARLPD